MSVLLGIQEPASAIASVLNLLTNVYMINKMRRSLAYRAPFKHLWYGFGLMSINAWIWSTAFHARDLAFTEKMDYFSAFALVLFQFNCFFVRVLKPNHSLPSQICLLTIIAASLAYYTYHVYYLAFVHFDYGYNMKVNVATGALNSLCWIGWSLYKYSYLGHRYAWRCTLAVLLIDILMSLEIFDFSPVLWLVDSHALWHISTVLIPFLWYQFVIEDNYYLELKSKSV